MEPTVTEALDLMSQAIENFFDSEAPADFESLLQYYAVVETFFGNKISSELSEINRLLPTLNPVCIGLYPREFIADFDIVSMLGLVEAKLKLITHYRSALRDLLTQWELAPPHAKGSILEQLSMLTAIIERDVSVISKSGVVRSEDAFIELLKSRKNNVSATFKFDLSAYNKTHLEAAVSGYRNTSAIGLRLESHKRNDMEFLEHLAMCFESLTKKLAMSIYALRLVKEYFTSVEGQ